MRATDYILTWKVIGKDREVSIFFSLFLHVFFWTKDSLVGLFFEHGSIGCCEFAIVQAVAEEMTYIFYHVSSATLTLHSCTRCSLPVYAIALS